MSEKKKQATGKNKTSPLNEMVLAAIEGMPPDAANMVIEAFHNIPFVVKDALDDFYKAKDGIDGKNGIDGIKEALERLKGACEANPTYQKLYSTAKDEANQEIAELYANGGMSV